MNIGNELSIQNILIILFRSFKEIIYRNVRISRSRSEHIFVVVGLTYTYTFFNKMN